MNTIVALATPPGQSGVAVIRLSGADALEIANKLLAQPWRPQHALMQLRTLCYAGEVLDHCLMVAFYAPHSFTGEEIVEIHAHGSSFGVRRMIDALIDAGAVPAQPGEFSKRAFLNGKMDLTQAEAVSDFIAASSFAASRQSMLQIGGMLKRQVLQYQADLTDWIAQAEAAVEYPEEDLETEIAAQVLPRVLLLKQQVQALLSTFREGKVIKEGVRVAIVGKPNVGKSSLLNALTQSDRAIVTDIAGTTRDVIEHTSMIGGYLFNFSDTAGMRRTDDVIENIGINRAKLAINEANIVILVMDATAQRDADDDLLLNQLKVDAANLILVFNKLDCCERRTDVAEFPCYEGYFPLAISVKTGENLELLQERLLAYAQSDQSESLLITNDRHAFCLREAIRSLDDAAAAMEQGIDMDCVVIDLRNAWSALGEITGNTVSEDIIDRIFEKFCLGK